MGNWKRERQRHEAAQKAQAGARGSPLLQLPAELRNRIYEYYLSDLKELHIEAGGALVSPPLGQVARQLRKEIKSMMCTEDLTSVRKVKACVHNFDFRRLAHVSQNLPLRLIELEITLSFGGKPTAQQITSLQEWVEDAPLLSVRTYKFTRPLMSHDNFDFFDRSMPQKTTPHMIWNSGPYARDYSRNYTSHPADPEWITISETYHLAARIQKKKKVWTRRSGNVTDVSEPDWSFAFGRAT